MARVLTDSEMTAITENLENMLSAATNLTPAIKSSDYKHLVVILEGIAAIANELKVTGKP